MRPFYFLLFLLFAQKITVAQNQYIPMVKEGKYWFISEKEIVSQKDKYYIYSFKGDSIVNNIKYKMLIKYRLAGSGIPAITTNSYIEALVREDSSARKVFQILTDPIVQSCSSEHIMYDFSLSIGDTLEDCNLAVWQGLPFPSRKIDTIIFQTIGNKDRRGLTYRALTLDDGLKYITKFTYFEGYGYQKSGIVLQDANCYKYCEGSLNDCDIVLANDEIERESYFRIFPNPILSHMSNQLGIKLKLPAFVADENLEISITDLRGAKIATEVVRLIGEASIDLSSLANGVYIAQLRSKGVVLAVEKLVIVR